MHSSIFGRFRALGRLILALTVAAAVLSTTQASAQQANSGQYSMQEIVDAGHSFFGSTSGGLAKVIEAAFQKYGLPNGYVLGQEGSGAFIAGLTYGEGQLNTKNAGEHSLYWQGPSLGIDYGGQGTRVMMLVYDLPSTDAIYARFGGVSGQAFVLAGFGMTLLKNNNVLIVPIRTGVGARLGLNVGYLKVTPSPTWNPF
ncbi:hypothetical protein ASE04_20550 [Rhizobium sp. Root708]|uniref:DUF1134 domain-containing protein n=1 Tax=Rhizobium sp. Root708 TaxID=1736592 RepID=UPI0006FD43DD|nr:EipA family protein [Rhizobium sp. Root708]KRB61901.1 hypothetical protein ASE04_20550 [Rhizobium sp. Root708]